MAASVLHGLTQIRIGTKKGQSEFLETSTGQAQMKNSR